MRYFDELFKVHPEEEWKSLENISRVYGLLLYSSQARTEAVQTKEVSQICHEVNITSYIPTLTGIHFISRLNAIFHLHRNLVQKTL